MQFHIDTQAFVESLPVMAYGLAGIFVVIGVIILAIWVLNKTTAKKGA